MCEGAARPLLERPYGKYDRVAIAPEQTQTSPKSTLLSVAVALPQQLAVMFCGVKVGAVGGSLADHVLRLSHKLTLASIRSPANATVTLASGGQNPQTTAGWCAPACSTILLPYAFEKLRTGHGRGGCRKRGGQYPCGRVGGGDIAVGTLRFTTVIMTTHLIQTVRYM
jgi:hypothetical protein